MLTELNKYDLFGWTIYPLMLLQLAKERVTSFKDAVYYLKNGFGY
jgi:hypothetical protein